ncbi:MAG: hypothetical protein Q7J85_06940 [Bacillota bacterium]|nr:hypothetical protein [Bacillota bacterium]
MKLYLWSFRNEGVFCEALASQIVQDVYDACKPVWCKVTVVQKPRGGIRISATAYAGEKDAAKGSSTGNGGGDQN